MAEIASFGVDVDENTKLAQNAQDTANTNATGIKNINDPNYLSPFEKPQLEIQMDNFATNYAADKDIATSESIDFTAYDAAYQAYLAYMTPLIADMTTYSPINRDTYNSMVTAVQAQQKAFDSATKAQYDTAINQAKTDIANGQAQYQTMQTDVANMKSNAANVATTASQAIASAGFANDTANAAQSSAMAAVNQAGFASDTSVQAIQAASSAVVAANEAAGGVTVAKNDAANALTSATTAFNTANGAKDSAGTALDNAKSALNKVNGMQIGGTNLLRDTEFTEDGHPHWQEPASLDVTDTYLGHKAVSFDETSLTGSGFVDFQQVIYSSNAQVVKLGEWYTLSFYAKGSGKFVSYVYPLTIDTNAGAYVDGKFVRYAQSDGNQIWALTNDWVRHTFTFKVNQSISVDANAVQRVLWRFYAGAKVSICMPQLEMGNLVSDYSQSPLDVQVQISDINGELASKVSQDTYNSLAGTVDQVSTLSKQNQSALVNKADSQTVDTLKQRVTTAENTLTQTATKTELQQTETDVDKLNDSVNTNTTDITAQAGKIDGLLSSTTDINGKLTTLQGSFDLSSQQLSTTMSKVDGQTTSINNLQADSSGFKAQFTTVNKALGKQTTDIGTLQASSKELSSNFDSLSTANGTNEHNISQLKLDAKGFSNTLETVQTQVQNSAVGTNLLQGTRDFSGNEYSSLNKVAVTNGQGQFQAITGTNHSTTHYDIANFVNLPLEKDTNYTASFWVKTSENIDINSFLFDSGSNGNYSDGSTINQSTTDYTRVVVHFHNGNNNATPDFIPVRIHKKDVTVWLYGLKLEKGSLATDWCPNPADNATVTALTHVKQTADGAQALATNNHGDITSLQETAKGLQSTVSSKASSDQLTQLSGQLTNKINDLSSSTSSQFTQTASDINNMVKKGDVVNQLNIDAGGILLDTSGSTAKIILSSNNIELDSANPVVMGSANITNLLTSKTIEASSITSTTKIIGSDIQAAMIHSADNSFVLDGNKGSIMGATITSTDNSWSISPTGKITGADVYAGGTYTYVASGSGNTVTGAIYNELDSNGYHQWTDANDHVRINNGVLTITNDADEKANANIEGIPLGVFISEGDTQLTGNLKIGNFYTNGGHTINSIDGGAVFLENGVSSGNSMVDFHAGTIFATGLQTNNLGLNNGHTLSSADGGGIYVEDTYNGGGNMVDFHVKKLYQSSLLSLKTDIKPIDPNTALETINNTDFMSYHFKNDKSNEPISVSPILDDINPIPKYNTPDIFKSADGASRNDGNILGYTALAVKALYAKVQDLTDEINKLEGAN